MCAQGGGLGSGDRSRSGVWVRGQPDGFQAAGWIPPPLGGGGRTFSSSKPLAQVATVAATAQRQAAKGRFDPFNGLRPGPGKGLERDPDGRGGSDIPHTPGIVVSYSPSAGGGPGPIKPSVLRNPLNPPPPGEGAAGPKNCYPPLSLHRGNPGAWEGPTRRSRRRPRGPSSPPPVGPSMGLTATGACMGKPGGGGGGMRGQK